MYYIQARVFAYCDETGDCGTAGNFCGVSPLIGRLRELLRGVYRRGVVVGRLLPVFSMTRNDTHGIADRTLTRTQPSTTYWIRIKEEHPQWQTKI